MEQEKSVPALRKKKCIGMEEAMEMYIREMKLASGLNTQRVFKAWDQASGAAGHTIGRFYRDGKLYITLSSSVVRSQLYFQKKALRESINEILKQDSLFTKDDKVSYVKEIILK